MLLAFKIIMISILCISFMGAVSEEKPDQKSFYVILAIFAMLVTLALFMFI